jgi:hypothetical protein
MPFAFPLTHLQKSPINFLMGESKYCQETGKIVETLSGE